MSGELVLSHRCGRERGHECGLRDRGLSGRAHDGETCLVMVGEVGYVFDRRKFGQSRFGFNWSIF